jgi:hypothetical protein
MKMMEGACEKVWPGQRRLFFLSGKKGKCTNHEMNQKNVDLTNEKKC